MRKISAILVLIVLISLVACTAAPAQNSTPQVPETGLATPGGDASAACQPTQPDMLGPFYLPGAPERDRVGEGYIMDGTVRSAGDCSPIENAQIELWMAGPDAVYRDEYRAVVYSSQSGEYSFESHFPPPYSGRPSHIHVRVTAAGYQELVTQHYPSEGTSQAVFDLVLEEN